MSKKTHSPLAGLPSVDHLLNSENAITLISKYGRRPVVEAIRRTLGESRRTALSGGKIPDETEILSSVAGFLTKSDMPSLRTVYNLTGTVLHTNLGRATLPEEAIEAVTQTARGASNLEYRIEEGKRGDRDEHIEAQLCEITGAEAATIVNNNAAAVMLVLNTFALGKEVPASRGELIEIGGSFRMPDIMAQSGCSLVEVGTTNRTHLKDYARAIGPNTGMIMKVHTSNYVVQGFTAEAPESDLAKLCHDSGIPFAIDLGSGTLTELKRLGLPPEPTPMDAMKNGADVVTFSGDKLLGGPQAGIIVGTEDSITRLKMNPMKRALRCDKMTIAAMSAVLRLYADPERLVTRVPTLRALARPLDDIREAASRIKPAIENAVRGFASVTDVDCYSQIGSGALPTRTIPSAGLSVTPDNNSGTALISLVKAFRALPMPVIGRVQDDAFILDLRCLEDEAGFIGQLPALETI
ncbi:MAG: L-seryl-tRNA(Sec) selenium transferase [Pseudomonadota bacterium]|nr:L-seryl-tRNA(Sec) selenium transferase [Pseudomonadota bacterium]